ncbi:MAG TPA: CAP domain-containing protein [Acidimicrobiales bacterium]|nr:CAP domain-containing protein [Acidimicrobiales bacterium]
MRNFRFVRAATVVAVLALVSTAAGTSAGLANETAQASPGDESAFVSAINRIRADRGLGSLRVDGELAGIARNWSYRMAADGAISHRPDLREGVSSNWTSLGENVGVGPSVSDLMNAFVNSPGHYKNIVEPKFTHIGVGAVVTDGMIYTAHEFMAVEGSSSAPAPAPAPAAPTRRQRVAAAPRPAVTAAPAVPRRAVARAAAPAPQALKRPAPPAAIAQASPPPPPPAPTARVVDVLDRLRGNPPTF